ncbi:50S ribosomal protein L6 [Oceanibacterium hippocampi]|uniref:Large ribosomal subunit protein uL6 n=1 Tax=Oceanibacterium hippocampi TaxID=745714 RepID=A0A1Y5SLC0_9PROT|nr:50S ribosomal protein L6 [Oceanibacterium hippocampi]SLN40333.1 50S ribosomal protein L6 [Oceanibacterium hippocampi]
MSRIGKHPVTVPSGVDVRLSGQDLTVKGSKGQLSLRLVDDIVVRHEDGKIDVKPRDTSIRGRMMWGMQRTLVSNMVVGVSEGFSKALEINGVGYRAAVQGNVLNLQLGFSHDVKYPIPEGISIAAESPTRLVVSGIDKQKVGQVAAEIRGYRPPEPYKGKGVKYADETIVRKEGKKK